MLASTFSQPPCCAAKRETNSHCCSAPRLPSTSYTVPVYGAATSLWPFTAMSILCAVIAAAEKALGSNRWPLSEGGICCSFVYFSLSPTMLFLLGFRCSAVARREKGAFMISLLPLNFQIKNADLLLRRHAASMLCREITQMKKTREAQEWMCDCIAPRFSSGVPSISQQAD